MFDRDMDLLSHCTSIVYAHETYLACIRVCKIVSACSARLSLHEVARFAVDLHRRCPTTMTITRWLRLVGLES
jgi:hypothetical protein